MDMNAIAKGVAIIGEPGMNLYQRFAPDAKVPTGTKAE